MLKIRQYILPLFGKYPQMDSDEFILLTYRSDIKPVLQTTYYNSDAGWGCMLRVGQMLIANILFRNVIQLFYDNLDLPFSFQNFTFTSSNIYPYMKHYQWFTPCQCGFIVKQLLQKFDQSYRVCICNDNSIFLSEIPIDRKKIIIFIMCRIGLSVPQPQHLKLVIQMMKNKFFFAIMGGTPKKAHLIIQHKNGYLGFLDPHNTQKTVKDYKELKNHKNQYMSKLEWMKAQSIDCSMCVSFYLHRENLQQFWSNLQQIKANCKDSFLFMEKIKPQFDNSCDIIQINQDDF